MSISSRPKVGNQQKSGNGEEGGDTAEQAGLTTPRGTVPGLRPPADQGFWSFPCMYRGSLSQRELLPFSLVSRSWSCAQRTSVPSIEILGFELSTGRLQEFSSPCSLGTDFHAD